MLKSTSCEMKTTTNRNERRPAAPRPAAEVLRYEVQPVTNWLSRTGRRESRCAGQLCTSARFHTPFRPVSQPYGVFILPSCIRYVHAPRDYISLLDNTTGRCVGTIKINVTPGDADWNCVIVSLAPLPLQNKMLWRWSLLAFVGEISHINI